jgi:hypothetical protein
LLANLFRARLPIPQKARGPRLKGRGGTRRPGAGGGRRGDRRRATVALSYPPKQDIIAAGFARIARGSKRRPPLDSPGRPSPRPPPVLPPHTSARP